MTLVQKLTKLQEVINSQGGIAFLKMRFMLEDVEREIQKGNPRAIQFAKEFDHVLRFCEMAAEKDL